jgi:hypothetical protein
MRMKPRVKRAFRAVGLALRAGDIDRAIRNLEWLREDLQPGDETPLEELGLTHTLTELLYDGNVFSIEQLSMMSDKQILLIKGIARFHLAPIRAKDFYLTDFSFSRQSRSATKRPRRELQR